MKKKSSYIFLSFGFFLLSSCYHPTPHQSFNDLMVLEGRWSSYEGVKFNESWIVVNDSVLKGTGFSLNGSDTVFSEQLILKRIGDTIFYGALVKENDSFIYFRIDKATRNSWVFKNPDHDYPNIIEYKIKNDSLLEATTSNIRGNKKITFKLRKELK